MANKYLDLQGLTKYDSNIKQKIFSDITDVKKDISKKEIELKSSILDTKNLIEEEINRAQVTEQLLSTSINNEIDRASKAEATLDKRIDDEIINRTSADTTLNTSLTKLIDTETARAKDAEGKLDEKFTYIVDDLNSELNSSLNNQINQTISTLRTEITNGDNTLNTSLVTEVGDRKAADAILQGNIDVVRGKIATEEAYRVNGDKQLQEQINNHLTTYENTYKELSKSISDTKDSINSHVSDENNPHKVTKEQLGLGSVDNTADLDKPISTATKAELDSIKTQLSELDQFADQLGESTVKNLGDQTIEGNLIIAKDSSKQGGNLVVQGDLEVKGSTKTVNQETVTVDDNFLIINNKGVSGIQSGIAIKKDSSNTAYGIAYDPATNSVNLGDGIIEAGEFQFSSNSNNPILTRAQDNTFTQDHILSWDNINKRAIDSGFSKEDIGNIQNKSSKNESDISSLNNKININTTDITAIKEKDTQQDKKVEDLYLKLNNKVDFNPVNADGTSALNTVSKNVVGSINELNKNIKDQTSNYNNHLLDYNNHIKEFKILEGRLDNTEPLIPVKNTAFNRPFYDGAPLMDGVASPGNGVNSSSPDETQVDNTVARGTHTHPTDTSRAPIDHSSTTTNYGVGSTTKYGHVKVDNLTSTTSENPIQNKIITSYIDAETTRAKEVEGSIRSDLAEEISRATEAENNLTTNLNGEISRAKEVEENLNDRINKLDYTSPILNNSETIEQITQTDGKILVTKKSIQIEMSQVTNLSKEFTDVRSEFANADRGLAEDYITRDTALKNDIDDTQARVSEIEQTISTVKDLNSSIQEIQASLDESNYTKKYVLGFEPKLNEAGNVTGYTPVFTNLDDGELT